MMKTIDKNRIPIRNFNEHYEDLTAEELIEKYNQVFLPDQEVSDWGKTLHDCGIKPQIVLANPHLDSDSHDKLHEILLKQYLTSNDFYLTGESEAV